MKAAVLTFPGSNCDEDLRYALEVSGFQVSPVWHKDTPSLGDFDLVGVPGGFSFGDYLRCGAIASHSPVVHSLREFADRGGYVIGICNGFQILCEGGLLPGALARNESLKFVCRDVELTVETTDSPWTCRMERGQQVIFPVAHGDGRYVVDADTHASLVREGRVLLRYRNQRGESTNPNGSVDDIAGVCNASRNVFGLMPHPERATDLRSKDGKRVWDSLIHHLREGGRHG